jgi:hypothetical protein
MGECGLSRFGLLPSKCWRELPRWPACSIEAGVWPAIEKNQLMQVNLKNVLIAVQ